jgi:hypothetical protein
MGEGGGGGEDEKNSIGPPLRKPVWSRIGRPRDGVLATLERYSNIIANGMPIGPNIIRIRRNLDKQERKTGVFWKTR